MLGVPGLGLVRQRVTDPYAVSSGADSRRAYVADLDDPGLAPRGWAADRPPDTVHGATDMVVHAHCRCSSFWSPTWRLSRSPRRNCCDSCPSAYSSAIAAAILIQRRHAFRFKPATDSDSIPPCSPGDPAVMERHVDLCRRSKPATGRLCTSSQVRSDASNLPAVQSLGLLVQITRVAGAQLSLLSAARGAELFQDHSGSASPPAGRHRIGP